MYLFSQYFAELRLHYQWHTEAMTWPANTAVYRFIKNQSSSQTKSGVALQAMIYYLKEMYFFKTWKMLSSYLYYNILFLHYVDTQPEELIKTDAD